MKPLAVDLCAGLGGWSDGLLAEGWDVVGFDIERHRYGTHQYPAHLILQDIRTIDGTRFRGKVSLIVASPPCQKYSYMAMPWSRAKDLARWYRSPEHPERIVELNELFNHCLRIGKEAQCPIVIENVRGAQPWVGPSKWMFGSFALWGDVPALMPMTKAVKSPSFRFDGSGRSFQTACVDGMKGVPHKPKGHWTNPDENGTKQAGISGPRNNGKGNAWFQDGAARHGSKSPARKAASAMIAKIPLVLARHIARCWKPQVEADR